MGILVKAAARTAIGFVGLCLAAAMNGYGQPAADASVQRTALKEIVETELAFARTALEEGTKNAFLKFLADDAVVFQPGPVDGLRAWRDRPVSKNKLVWHPSWAGVSADGMLGWTTGPWRLIGMSPARRDTSYGQFFTVWRRQPDGRWKVELDVGVSHAAPRREAAVFDPATAGPPDGRRSTRHAPSDLVETLEQSFAAAARERGMARAYQEVAADSIRLLRPARLPMLGTKPFGTKVFSYLRLFDWKMLKGAVASSGDLGYSYGSFEAGSDERMKGWFVRIWENVEGKGWKLLVDIWTYDEE